VSTSVVKWIEGPSNRVSNIITRYKDQVKFDAYMAVPFISFFWFYFLSFYVRLYVL